jgi:hypothetical protein
MAQPVKVSAMKDLVVDDGIAPCPSHGPIVEQPKEGFHRILYLTGPFALRQRRSRIHTASPVVSRLVSLKQVVRDHQNHCPDWLFRGYLVLYLAGLFPPEALIIGMLLPPRLDFAVAALEIIWIGLQPSLVALPLAFRSTRWALAALLDPLGPRIRFVIPAAVSTPLLSVPRRFHPLILTDKVIVEPTDEGQGMKRMKYIKCGGWELNQE